MGAKMGTDLKEVNVRRAMTAVFIDSAKDTQLGNGKCRT